MSRNPVDRLVERMLDPDGDFRWDYKVVTIFSGRGKTREAILTVTPEYTEEKTDGIFTITIKRG